MDRSTVLRNISSKEMVGAVIWIVLAVLQILLGIAFIDYYWVTLIIGVWNLVNGIIRTTKAGKVEERGNGIVEEYEKDLTNLIIFLVLNIFIGGLIGVIGVIYDIVTRNYVLNNKNIILGTATATYTTNNGSNNKYEDLEKLMELKEKGILTEVEYEIEKAKILK